MPDLPVPNTVQVDVIYLLFGQRVENVWHATFPTGVDAVTLSDTEAAFAGWTAGTLMPLLSNELSFIGMETTNISIPNGGKRSFSQVPPVAGGVVIPSEPGNVSFCLSLRTQQTGRAYRGRKYIPGMPGNKRSGNQVLSGWATSLVQAMDDLIAGVQAINGFLSVVSRTLDLVERLVPVATAVTSITYTDLNINSQRRRLTGLGT